LIETILYQHGFAFVGIELHLGKLWFNVSKSGFWMVIIQI